MAIINGFWCLTQILALLTIVEKLLPRVIVIVLCRTPVVMQHLNF